MVEQNGVWPASDGTPLRYTAVFSDPADFVPSPASGAARPTTHGASLQGLVLIVHGMSEHRGRYRALQEDLARAGVDSYAYDQRGFGESGGLRTYVRTFHEYLDDLDQVVRRLKEIHSDRPLFLLGHSMGGLVTLAYCIRENPRVHGVVVSAPVVIHKNQPLRIRFFAYLLTYLMPRLSVVYGNEVTRFSHDPKVIDAFLKDPLCQKAGTPRYYTEFQRMRRYLLRGAGRIRIPILILQGTADEVVFPKGATLLYDRVESRDKTLIWYEDFFHEPFNEIGRERVVRDTLQWIRERALGKPKASALS